MRMFRDLALISSLALLSLGAHADAPGRFVTVGPMDAPGDVMSMKWRYGYLFTTRPEANATVRFACNGIPESAVSVRGADLAINERGVAFVDSAATPVSKQATPWLFDAATTHADCSITVSAADGKQIRESVPLAFPPEAKSVLQATLKEAFELNKKPEPAK